MIKKKILTIKDERFLADVLNHRLEVSGFAADTAFDSGAGLKLFADNQYDLIIIDSNLAGDNAFELCRELRLSDKYIPIIFLTSQTEPINRLESYQAGANDYIIKPFEFKELLFKINAHLNPGAVGMPIINSTLIAADLELNTGTKEVRRSNKQISLTGREFQLLEYLLRNKNKVVSRSDIALHVWHIDFDTKTNFVDVYINYLRNKIDKDSDLKLIRTQMGVGYILKDE